MRKRSTNDSRVVLDARWVGHTGIGRLTESLLEGFAALAPPGWVIWGPAAVGPYVWNGADHTLEDRPPLMLAAQGSVLRVPRGVHLTPHAVRPLHPGRPAVVILNDLIPVLFSSNRAARVAWRAFLTASVRQATTVVVYSEATCERLRWLAPSVHPVKVRLGGTTLRIRAEPAPSGRPTLLYVGQLKTHKNLVAAIEGFGRSSLARSGGRFLIVGPVGNPAPLRAAADRTGVKGSLEILDYQSDESLDELYRSSSAVIQPSLEEGWGLPAREALLRGVPVACSDIAAHRESVGDIAVLFDPFDPSDIARAVDEAVARRTTESWYELVREWTESNEGLSPAGFAEQFLPILERARRARS